MARPRATLRQRGRLYAAKRIKLQDPFARASASLGWVAGYKAAQNDARELRRGKR